jgi:biopolymer transport protein ExbD
VGEGSITVGCGAVGPLGFLRTTVLVQMLLGPALLVPWLLSYPPQQHRVMAPAAQPAAAAGAPSHKLVLTAQGTAILDGEPLGLVDLHNGLNRIGGLEPGAELRFQPDPAARYESFLELLAMTRRVPLERVRIDNSGLVGALDE